MFQIQCVLVFSENYIVIYLLLAIYIYFYIYIYIFHRGGSRTAATSKMELFAIIVNSFQSLTIITKCSILDVAAGLDLPLLQVFVFLSNPHARLSGFKSYSSKYSYPIRLQDCLMINIPGSNESMPYIYIYIFLDILINLRWYLFV